MGTARCFYFGTSSFVSSERDIQAVFERPDIALLSYHCAYIQTLHLMLVQLMEVFNPMATIDAVPFGNDTSASRLRSIAVRATG